jgi:hypothetical protein
MLKSVTVNDLRDHYVGPQPMLWCPKCGECNSATLGDYFWMPADKAFRHCGRNMRLVTKRTVIEQYKVAA